MTKEKIEDITIAEIQKNPVWRFGTKSPNGKMELTAVKKLPRKNLTGCIAGTQVRLADGTLAWSFLEYVASTNPKLTEHFMTISIESEGKWFHLARYHDFDFGERNPEKLAAFLKRRTSDVFPIQYDIRSLSEGDPAALCGLVRSEPRERLTRAEVIALAVP